MKDLRVFSRKVCTQELFKERSWRNTSCPGPLSLALVLCLWPWSSVSDWPVFLQLCGIPFRNTRDCWDSSLRGCVGDHHVVPPSCSSLCAHCPTPPPPPSWCFLSVTPDVVQDQRAGLENLDCCFHCFSSECEVGHCPSIVWVQFLGGSGLPSSPSGLSSLGSQFHLKFWN